MGKPDSSDTTRMWGFLTYAEVQSAVVAVSTLHEKLMLPGSVRPIAVSFARNSSATKLSVSGSIDTSVGQLVAATTPGGLLTMAPDLVAAGVPDSGWRVYYNSDGIPYYHHAASNRTQWECPP